MAVYNTIHMIYSKDRLVIECIDTILIHKPYIYYPCIPFESTKNDNYRQREGMKEGRVRGKGRGRMLLTPI